MLVLENNNSYGIRDPHPLIDNNYTPIKIDGQYILYFNQRDIVGGRYRTCPRVATSFDFKTWEINKNPVFIDGDYCAMGSVLLDNDAFYLYYSPDTKKGFKRIKMDDPYGSTDKTNEEFFLRVSQFNGISLMGLPFVSYIEDRYYCLFEGYTSSGFNIFMAESLDNQNWTPSNNGNPIYNYQHDFEIHGQANPSIYKIKNNFYLFYNGCRNGGWSINFGTSEGIMSKYQTNPKPLISSRKDLKRIEGARLIKTEGSYKILYFICPTNDSYKNGKIYIESLFD